MNGFPDVYLYDRRYDYLHRISVPGGVEGQGQGNGASYAPVLTPDGHTVVFLSQAGNLPDGGEVPAEYPHRLFVWGR